MRFTNLGGLMAALSLLACANVYAGLSSGEPIYFYDMNGNKVGQGSAKSTVDDIIVDSGSTASLKSFDGGGAQQMMLLPGDVEIAESLKGKSSVSPTGVARYSIPIQLPRSLAGFGPSLSIEYSSQSQSGLLGAGWSISGLQQISRCPQTIAQDGVRRSVRFDANDRFCLNGQRLVLISGTYGGAGAEYRTEIESFAKIVSYGTAGAGPEHFKVWTKGGQIMEFGATSDSRLYTNSTDSAGVISQQATVQAWSLNRVEDRKSNYWTISYESSLGDGLLYPSYMQYAGNANENVLPLNRVDFLYENALPGEVSLQYQAGSRSSLGKRMDMVKSSVNGEPATEYRFEYDELDDDGNDFVRSRLASITECRYQQGVAHCLLPAEFEWSSDASFNVPDVTTSEGDGAFANVYYYWPSPLVGDISGDGRADVVTVLVSWHDGLLRVRSMLAQPGDNSSSFGETILEQPSGTYYDTGNNSKYALADVNLDGRADIVIGSFGESGLLVYTLLSNGDGTFQPASSQLIKAGNHSHYYNLYVKDINADGIPDYVAYLEERSERRSTVVSTLRDINGNLSAPTTTVVNYPSGPMPRLLDRTFGDINGDGNPDLVIGAFILSAEYHHYAAFVSLGDGLGGFAANATEVVAAAGTEIFDATDPVIRNRSEYYYGAYDLSVVDVNRDGLIDIVLDMVIPSDICEGAGCDPDPVFDGCRDQSGGCDAFLQGAHVALSRGDLSFQLEGGFYNGTGAVAAGSIVSWTPAYGDVDGDGALDIIRISRDASFQLWILVSLGLGNGDFRLPFGGAISNGPVASGIGLGGSGMVAVQNDINVDGIPDIILPWIYTDSSKGDTLAVHVTRWVRDGTDAAQQQNLLTGVNAGNGESTEFDYRALPSSPSIYQKDTDATYPLIDLNMPMLVVEARQSLLNGIQQSVDNYFYQGAKADLSGRGFLGFRSQRVATTMAATLLKPSGGGGMQEINKEITYQRRQDFPFTGMPISITKKIDYVTIEHSFSDPQQDFSFVNTYTGVYFPKVDKVTSAISDPASGSLISTSERTSVYDNNGNELLTSTTSQNADATQAYTQSISRIFYTPDLASWIIDLVDLQTTTYQRTGLPDIAQETHYEYFPDGYLKIEEVEPNIPALNFIVEYAYDPYGNQASKIISGVGDPAYPDTAIQARASQNFYEAGAGYPAGVFLTKEINPLNHAVEYQYDPLTAVATQITDANDLVTTIDVDALGREIFIQTPDNVQASSNYELCGAGVAIGSGTTECEIGEYLRITSTRTGAAPSYTFQDGAGRDVRSAAIAYDGVEYSIQRNEYDEIGRLKRASKPAFSSVAYGSLLWTNYVYDNVGRVLEETLPGNRKTSISYNGLERAILNAKLQTRIERMNVVGETIEVEDALGSVMKYSLDSAGRLVGTEDQVGNEVVLLLDKYGRKLQQLDPDFGVWSYRYNVIGELVWQQDAEAQVATFAYDKLGRMNYRNEADLVSSWVWDTAFKGVGKLALVSSDNGFSRTYEYDAQGRAERVITGNSIDIHAQPGDPDFVHATSYDAAGRISTQTYPTGFGYQNFYDSNGYLSEVRDIATAELYWRAERRDAEGRVTRETLGNNLVTDRLWDENNGLLETVQTGTLSGSLLTASVQNDGYGYDALGNLISRSQYFGSVSRVENLGYDILNRLTSVVPLEGTPEYITYDLVGNMQSRTSVGAYQYTGCGGGHRLCGTSGVYNTAIAYDDNGNMLSDGIKLIEWTAANYVRQITQGSVVEEFLYNPERERVRVISTQGSATTATLYLNPRIDKGNTFEKRYAPNGDVTFNHYIYAGSQLIGNVERKALAEAASYFHQDHLGSIVAITDENGDVLQRLSYDAWGKRLEPDPANRTFSGTQLWATDLTVAPTTADPNSEGLTMPGVSSIYWQQTNGDGALYLDSSINDGLVSAVGQRTYDGEHILYRLEVSFGKDKGKRIYIGERLVDGSLPFKGYNHHYLRFNQSSCSIESASNYTLDGGPRETTDCDRYIDDDPLGTVYIVEIDSSHEASTLYFYRAGEARGDGVSQTVNRVLPPGLSRRLELATERLRSQSGYARIDNLTETLLIENAPVMTSSERHGYTGHEHIDTLGLINMNGRIFNPVLGRFMSPDPNVFYPENMQDFNRYSYVQNNPLSFTDPSGFMTEMDDFAMNSYAIDRAFNSIALDAANTQIAQFMNSSSNNFSSSNGDFQLYGSNYGSMGSSQITLYAGSSSSSNAGKPSGTLAGDVYGNILLDSFSGVGIGVHEARSQTGYSLWDVVKEGASAQIGPGVGYHLREFKAGPLKFGFGAVFASGGVGLDSEGWSAWGKSTADFQLSAGRYGGRVYIWDIDIDSKGVNNIDYFGGSRPSWDWSIGIGGTVTPYSVKIEYDFQPLIDYFTQD